MNIQRKQQPSAKAQAMLDSLRSAVAEALDKKRRLGHYAVVWDGEKPVRRDFRDPPSED